MPTLPFYWIDAFTDRPFGGNPAAVVPLTTWLPDAELQTMARQHGLSETTFFVPRADGSFALRWFTPDREVDLCGHATLAAATVLFAQTPDRRIIAFESCSGPLRVRRDPADRYELDFPSRPPSPEKINDHPELLAALGLTSATWIGRSRDYFVVLQDQSALANLRPDFTRLRRFEEAVIVTAPGDHHDYVSRHFAPSYGIDEDPVTGSAQCTLAPYWSHRLNQTTLTGRQISARGGDFWCAAEGDRVRIAGHAAIYLRGELTY